MSSAERSSTPSILPVWLSVCWLDLAIERWTGKRFPFSLIGINQQHVEDLSFGVWKDIRSDVFHCLLPTRLDRLMTPVLRLDDGIRSLSIKSNRSTLTQTCDYRCVRWQMNIDTLNWLKSILENQHKQCKESTDDNIEMWNEHFASDPAESVPSTRAEANGDLHVRRQAKSGQDDQWLCQTNRNRSGSVHECFLVRSEDSIQSSQVEPVTYWLPSGPSALMIEANPLIERRCQQIIISKRFSPQSSHQHRDEENWKMPGG